jgi:putative transposase
VTLPKRRLPGTAYFLSPVCDRREFRLKPTPETNAAFAFTLVESALRHGIDVIAVMQMSSHYHAVVYDRVGRLSDFLRDFHAPMAKYGNTRDGVENTKFWSAEESETVEIGDMDTLVAMVAYTLANPTKDFIVERPEMWIGAMTPVDTLGSGMGKVYQRPDRFFDPDGMTSESVMLTSDYPWELHEIMPLEDLKARVKARGEAYIAEAQAEVAAGRRKFSGLEKAKKLSVWHSANIAPSGEVGKRVKPRKRVAAAAKEGRLKAMLDALLEFRRAHRKAWAALRRGVRTVMFPAGTWFAWRFYGAMRKPGVNEVLEAPS